MVELIDVGTMGRLQRADQNRSLGSLSARAMAALED